MSDCSHQALRCDPTFHPLDPLSRHGVEHADGLVHAGGVDGVPALVEGELHDGAGVAAHHVDVVTLS